MLTLHKRRNPRRPVGAPGIIYAGRQALPCVIADICEGGARLRVGVDVDVAPLFDLFMTAAEPMQTCRKVWRSGDLVGVAFV